MKINVWVLMMLSTSLLAQQATNTPSAPPATAPAAAAPADTGKTNAPAANAPATKSKQKSAPKKKPQAATVAKKDPAAELKTVPLVPGPAVVDADHVNVRGQAKLKSEVVTRLNKGQPVTVLEEIVNNNSGLSEPSAWAKVVLPTNAPAWINTPYIDAANKTVIPKRLNVRSGPGENYSVLGRLEHGDPVKEVETKGAWTRIEPPANAYAFMAAQYLKQVTPEAPLVAANTTEPKPAPATPTTVPDAPTIAAPPTETPATTPATAPATNPATADTLATTNPPAATIEPIVAPEPPPKRIVQREGVVRGTFSIQAPTHFELVSPETGRTIDYLYTTAPNLDLRRYKGLRIIVAGEEGLEERWGNTPVLTIQRIQVLE